VQRAEGFALEAQAFGGRNHAERRWDRVDLDVTETGLCVEIGQHAFSTQAKWARLARQRRRELDGDG
jgi:hypothetical protein